MKIGHFQIAMLNSNASEMGQGEVYRIELTVVSSFFSALWKVFPESWKRSCSNFYAHDCMSFLRAYIVIKTILATKVPILKEK